jgi:hypothetical protein
VDFVNDVDFVLAFAGRKMNLVSQVADLVNATIAGRVELDQVEQAAFGDGVADSAVVARAIGRVKVEAVDALASSGLSSSCRAARAGEE